MKHFRIFAFGGNEVAPSGEVDENGKPVQPAIPLQFRQTVKTCSKIVNIIKENPDDAFIITHGNGPQVGGILMRSEYASKIIYALPLDVCDADTQGGMGFMLSQLQNVIRAEGINKTVTALVTRVMVDQDDPAFDNPTKFIGMSYSPEDVPEKEKLGWKMKFYKKDDNGKEIWRRVVPSPKPVDIVDFDSVIKLIEAGIIPITVGGGGIPVIKSKPEKNLEGKKIYKTRYDIDYEVNSDNDPVIVSGVDAVIDKDLASSFLGKKIIDYCKKNNIDAKVSLTIFTGTDGIKLNYQQPDEKSISKITASELKKLKQDNPKQFPDGSMGPKIDAVIDFIQNGGDIAYITTTDAFDETVKGKKGTVIIPD